MDTPKEETIHWSRGQHTGMHTQTATALIERLYLPHQTAAAVGDAQRELQLLQRQPDADTLAHSLLQASSQNVQFFGALTYTVYFTNHANSINTAAFAAVLVDEVVDAYRRSLPAMVVNKLTSNLAKVYIKLLTNPLDILLERMAAVQNNQNALAQLALLSCKIFAEELNSSTETLNKEQHETVVSTLFNTTTKNVLNTTLSPATKKQWLECLQAWMSYITKIEFDYTFKIDLNDYFNITIQLMFNNTDIDALSLTSEVYDTNPSLLNRDNKAQLDAILFSEWTPTFIKANADDIENLSKLSRFITLFLDSDMINLASKIIDPEYDYKFQFLLDLTSQDGIPILNEPFSVDMLDFWILFTECFVNDLDNIEIILKNDEEKMRQLNQKAQGYFLNLSQIYWNKCHLFDADDLEDIEDEFVSFRRDVGELFETLFSIARVKIFNNLSSSIINTLNTPSLSTSKIRDIEASLYLLTSISSILTENGIIPQFLTDMGSLFKCKFLEKILSVENDPHYKYLIKISIKFLSEINWFYETPIGQTHINDVLVFLFQNLNNKIYQESSSKAISMITDTCRTKLSGLINDFESAAISMIANKFDVEINVRARIIKSYANILQTIQNLDLQASKISVFLEFIYSESINAYESILSNKGNPEVLENIDNFLLSMVSSLVGLAKGLQLPEDWEDYYDENEQSVHGLYNYWKFDDQYQVHDKCIKLISLYSFPQETVGYGVNLRPKMLEQVYQFFKCGLTEPFPGAFVIEEDQVIQYILKCCAYCQQNPPKSKNSESAMIKIIELYGLVVNSNHVAMTIGKTTNLQLGIPDLGMDLVIDEMLFRQFDTIMSDPDSIQKIFELFAGILAKYPTELLKNREIMKILEISVQQLYTNNQQRFVIMALSKLWSNLIYLRRGKQEDAEFVNRIMVDEGAGKLLVYALMKGFMNTSRSIVEFYSDILRALTARYSKYLSVWIQESFEKINTEKNSVKPQDVNLFTKKLILTRGNRAANKVIQDFWFTITGMVDYGM